MILWFYHPFIFRLDRTRNILLNNKRIQKRLFSRVPTGTEKFKGQDEMDIISLEEVDLYLKCLSSQLNLFNLEFCFWFFFFFFFSYSRILSAIKLWRSWAANNEISKPILTFSANSTKLLHFWGWRLKG